jgi:choline dehydrogenase-like flavoprotein
VTTRSPAARWIEKGAGRRPTPAVLLRRLVISETVLVAAVVVGIAWEPLSDRRTVREGVVTSPRRRSNLRIETEALATRILFHGKRAVGVAYLQRGEAREARCRREAILGADELDRRTLVAGFKIARRIVSNPALDRYCAFELNPGDQCQSDDDFLDYARRSGQTAFQVIGTCTMGNDPMAVVDDELRVRELEGLRVVDASIMPTMVSGNTNASVIMIAEKGADMIKAAGPRRARAA